MDINFDNVKSKLVDRGVQLVHLSDIGFILTDEDICRYNAMIVLSNMSNVESKLSEQQQQNLIAMYNELIIMQ
jgi:hypothetical protein